MFYDELDELGQDKRLPRAAPREFVYDPDIISERLVRLQQFIHAHHGTIERALDGAVDGLFYAEHKTVRAFNWLEHDAPSLLLPTAQMMASGYFAYLMNRTASPAARLGRAGAIGALCGFLVYPSWRRRAGDLISQQLIGPFPPIQRTVRAGRTLYERRIVGGIVEGWNAYDRTRLKMLEYVGERRRRVMSILKPPRRPPPTEG